MVCRKETKHWSESRGKIRVASHYDRTAVRMRNEGDLTHRLLRFAHDNSSAIRLFSVPLASLCSPSVPISSLHVYIHGRSVTRINGDKENVSRGDGQLGVFIVTREKLVQQRGHEHRLRSHKVSRCKH
ncbi:hypothetical protein M408DRAFT_178017 [Serendipita vermifera MAFF 305830]|uniref:Uncharacterized protein n=1 Tax=Serendipita vermifera MAFF 305830 TaxID=933852 RepID=A0A0C3B3P7_SERVB|nr:hypothetical protein M408DRAFT_178017 [Serendipita vermifera MAFF 305830]